MQTTANTVSSYTELERGVHAALETYSNVHRGSGQFSLVTTWLFEQARNIVLEYLELNKDKYVVIFCTPGGAEALIPGLEPGSYKVVSSLDFDLPLGVRALAVKRKALKGKMRDCPAKERKSPAERLSQRNFACCRPGALR